MLGSVGADYIVLEDSICYERRHSRGCRLRDLLDLANGHVGHTHTASSVHAHTHHACSISLEVSLQEPEFFSEQLNFALLPNSSRGYKQISFGLDTKLTGPALIYFCLGNLLGSLRYFHFLHKMSITVLCEFFILSHNLVLTHPQLIVVKYCFTLRAV